MVGFLKGGCREMGSIGPRMGQIRVGGIDMRAGVVIGHGMTVAAGPQVDGTGSGCGGG